MCAQWSSLTEEILKWIQVAGELVETVLTHLCLASCKRDIDEKQNTASDQDLFKLKTRISIKDANNKT